MELGGIHIPTWLAVVVPLFCYWLRGVTRKFGTFRALGIRGPMPLPIMGTMYKMMQKGMTEYDMYLREKYGDIVGTFQGGEPVMVIYDKDILKQIMGRDFQHFRNRYIVLLGGYGVDKMLIALKDNEWLHVRTTLTPTFSSGRLRRMTAVINRCALAMSKHLEKDAREDASFDVKELVGAYTMDVIASTAFGLEIDSQNNPNNEFVRYGKQAFDFSFKNPRLLVAFFLPFLSKYIGIFPKDMKNFFMNVVSEALEARKDGSESRGDFLQLMVNAHQLEATDAESDEEEGQQARQPEHKRGLTHEEVLSQGFVFFVTGFETTANTVTFVLYNLACNPDKQDLLVVEIDQAMEGHDEPDYDLIRGMNYLGMVVDETMRMFPQVHKFNRVAQASVTINGVHIPKDMVVGIPVYALHHDPEVWPEPEKFIPERFTPEQKQTRHPCAFLPFGMGPRSCIAMRLALLEVKIALVQLLRRYRFAACDKTEIPVKLEKINVRAEKAIYLKVVMR